MKKIKENVIKKKIVFAIKNWNDASDVESAKWNGKGEFALFMEQIIRGQISYNMIMWYFSTTASANISKHGM